MISLPTKPIYMILMLAISYLASSGAAVANEQVSIHLKWLHQFQSAGYFTALEKGFYRDEGLHVKLIEGGPGRAPMESLLSGDVQYAVADAGALLYRAEGKPVVALATVFQHSPQIILVRKDAATHTPADLRGKRIMLQDGFLTIEVLAVLEKFGIHENDFIRQPIGTVDDLIQGRTDAWPGYSANEPFLMKHRGIPFQVFYPRDYGIDFYGDMLVTTEQEIETNPERAAAIRRATLRGWQYALKHPDEIIDLIINKYNSQHKSRAHLAFEARAIDELMFSDVIEIGYTNPARWQDIANIYAQYGLLPEGFSFDGFLYQPSIGLTGIIKANIWQFSSVAIFLILLLLAAHSLRLRRVIEQRTKALRSSNIQLSQEITGHKQTENMLTAAKQKAEQASHAKSEFLSVMSHELRTPLHGIIGMLDLLSADKQLPDEHKNHVQSARHVAQSLKSLVDDILDLSKIEAGVFELHFRTCDTESCLRDSLLPFLVVVKEKGLNVNIIMDNVPATIYSDTLRIRQILLNLVGNAIKFTDQGSVDIHISCSTLHECDALSFEIRDSGIGILPEHLEQVFTPFTQLKGLMQRNHDGTGLGTTIAKRLVNLMGGEIAVASTPGIGSTFTFSIPCKMGGESISRHMSLDDLLCMQQSPQKSTIPNQIAKGTILLAEDDPISQKIAFRKLSRAGFKVEVAEDGLTALRKATENVYDLILLDIRMPGMDGITVTKNIRSLAENEKSQTPIIGLSAHAMEDVQQDCIDAGMDRFMSKPVEPDRIIEMIHSCLQSEG